MRKKDCKSVIQPLFAHYLGRPGYQVHHVFPGVARRKKCEKYGFLVCIPGKQHEEAHKNINSGESLEWKQAAQRWYENNVGSREDWIEEFLRSYL